MNWSPTHLRVWWNKTSRKYHALGMTILAVIVFLIAAGLTGLTIWKHQSLNEQTQQLRTIQFQDIERYKNNEHTANLYATWDTIDDVITSLQDFRSEREGYEQYQSLLNNPYNYFLQYKYLPRLNIRENPYTDIIDISLIGSRFLEENPYTDLALINTWTRTFEDIWDIAKDLGVSSANEVKNIEIKPIRELENWYFAIPISLTFESVDRRAFLLLMEKLAMTSHHSNITLFNEFFFHIWETIKKEYWFELENLVINEWNMASEKDIDKKLGYLFDQWINRQWRDFVDEFAQQQGTNAKSMDEIIALAIRSSTWCTNQTTKECEYLFREKFRTIPYLIYPITNERKSKWSVLKDFISSTLPPIIKINEFTFDDTIQQRGGIQTAQFEGTIEIEVFGRGISDNELNDIAQTLWTSCFDSGEEMSPERSLDVIEENIIQMSRINTLDTERASQLFELKEILQNVQEEYQAQTPYNKIIKLFEIYRMLHDASVCDAWL